MTRRWLGWFFGASGHWLAGTWWCKTGGRDVESGRGFTAFDLHSDARAGDSCWQQRLVQTARDTRRRRSDWTQGTYTSNHHDLSVQSPRRKPGEWVTALFGP
jgi:hypothetical protein